MATSDEDQAKAARIQAKRDRQAQEEAAAATGVNQPQEDLPKGIEPTTAGAEGNLPQDLSTRAANQLSANVANDPQRRSIGEMQTLTEASQFRVLHDSVGPFQKGEVVTLQQLGGESQNVMRLIELEAIEPA